MICTIINQYSGKVKGKREKKGEKVKRTREEQPVCAAAVAGEVGVDISGFACWLIPCARWLRVKTCGFAVLEHKKGIACDAFFQGECLLFNGIHIYLRDAEAAEGLQKLKTRMKNIGYEVVEDRGDFPDMKKER